MTQRQKVLSMLREAGPTGVLNTQFYREYLPRAAARIEELRDEGYKIKTIRINQSTYRYVLEQKDFGRGVKDWRAEKKRQDLEDLESRGQGRLI